MPPCTAMPATAMCWRPRASPASRVLIITADVAQHPRGHPAVARAQRRSCACWRAPRTCATSTRCIEAGANEVFSGEGEVALALTEAILQRLGATAEQMDRERVRGTRSCLAPSMSRVTSRLAYHVRYRDAGCRSTPVPCAPPCPPERPGISRRPFIRPFRSFGVPLIDGPRQPTAHLVRVTLPDLSVLAASPCRFSPAISPTGRHAANARGCFSAVSAAPRSTWRQAAAGASRWCSQRARLAQSRAGPVASTKSASRADSDDWRLVSLEASNAFAAAGRGMALVPCAGPRRSAHPCRSRGCFSWCSARWRSLLAPGPAPTWLRWPHQIAAGLVIGALTVAWLLPLASNRRVLVTPSVFWVAIGVLFLPALAPVALATLRWATALTGVATRFWRRHATTCERGAASARAGRPGHPPAAV